MLTPGKDSTMGDLSRRYLEKREQEDKTQLIIERKRKRSARQAIWTIIGMILLSILIITPLIMRAFASNGLRMPQRISVGESAGQRGEEQDIIVTSHPTDGDVSDTGIYATRGDETTFMWDSTGDGTLERYRIVTAYDRMLDASIIAQDGIQDDAFHRIGDTRGFIIEEMPADGDTQSQKSIFIQDGYDPEVHVFMRDGKSYIDVDYQSYATQTGTISIRIHHVDGKLIMANRPIG